MKDFKGLKKRVEEIDSVLNENDFNVEELRVLLKKTSDLIIEKTKPVEPERHNIAVLSYNEADFKEWIKEEGLITEQVYGSSRHLRLWDVDFYAIFTAKDLNGRTMNEVVATNRVQQSEGYKALLDETYKYNNLNQ